MTGDVTSYENECVRIAGSSSKSADVANSML